MLEIAINTEEISVVRFLKWSGEAGTGGQARQMIAAGKAQVNGTVEFRPGRILKPGDRVSIDGREYILTAGHEVG